MAGDVRNPFGDLKGYQFWALMGLLLVFIPRILLAFEIPLGIFTMPIWEGEGTRIILTDFVGSLIATTSYLDYREFLK